MKKTILRWLCFTLAFTLAICPALANSWGLTGRLLTAVARDNRWGDYSTITRQQDDFAVMGGRYHNVLMQYKDGELFTYPLAVYQPADPFAKKVQLNLRSDGQVLDLTFGSHESYSFQLKRRFDTYWTADALIHAYVNGLNFQRDGYGFRVSDGEQEIFWQNNVLLDTFNIKLFPRSLEEVRHLNRMYALLDSAMETSTETGHLLEKTGKGTLPVYSAPDASSAWRAANGKAAVGMAGRLWAMGTIRNEKGEVYTKIRYEVSERTQRIGFIQKGDLLYDSIELTDSMIHVPLETRRDTWLTDDPMVSQYQQFYVPKGTQFTCMGLFDKEYAWVSAKAKNNSFVNGGKPVKNGNQIVWGYVPLRDLMISSSDPCRGTIEWDVMADYSGQWQFTAGGVGISDVLMLNPDGTWEGYTDQVIGGTWQLTHYNPSDGLYWADVPYEITFFQNNGSVTTLGFQPVDDGFSLLTWEGSGGYGPSDGTFAPPEEGANG